MILGVVALCPNQNKALLAFPGLHKGHIQLADLSNLRRSYHSILPAHEHPLACLAFSLDGKWLASASEKGTLLRIYETDSGRLVHELRRGSDKAEIYSMAFNQDASRLVVSSDHGTVHIFNLDGSRSSGMESPSPAAPMTIGLHQEGSGIPDTPPQSSGLSFVRDYLPKYFSSQWSFAYIKGPELPSICCFGQDGHSIYGKILAPLEGSIMILCWVVVSLDGVFYKFLFDPVKGGEGIREFMYRFMDNE